MFAVAAQPWVAQRCRLPAIASDGWRKDAILIDGLEQGGEALREYMDEARTNSYRHERGDDRYSWRFTRDQRS